MPVKCQVIMEAIDDLAPRELAENWDNVGLLAGSPAETIHRVMVCLDVNGPVVDAAVKRGANLIVTHHPLIFQPLKRLRTDLPQGKLLAAILKHGLAVFAAHTNLDAAAGGVNDVLAQKLELTEVEPLADGWRETLLKIVVFAPRAQAETVFQAMTDAGAGHIGRYSHCAFQTEGTGTFLPLAGTRPFIGEPGRLERVEEARLETIVPEKQSARVIRAMLRSHPYEEVAYDVYRLENKGRGLGLGRLGRLKEPVAAAALIDRLKKALHLPYVRLVGDAARPVRKIAVCGGSGADLIGRAAWRGADVLITGDVKYHEAQKALDLGIQLIDAGHFGTEQPVVAELAAYLRRCGDAGKWRVDVLTDDAAADVFQTV